MRAISFEKKRDIEAKLRSGTPYTDISKSVNVSLSTVSKIAKELSIPSPNHAGRPNIISTSLGRKVIRAFLSGKYKTAVEAQKGLRAEGEHVSAHTIRRLLKSNNLNAKTKKPALPLTPIRKKKPSCMGQKVSFLDGRRLEKSGFQRRNEDKPFWFGRKAVDMDQEG
ncbi:hypothetical protein BCR42DRAFT_443804 [Absidia repens]|uniref:Transposase Tc1-like domain-containing protein n=1 Tax=Absidia repens TaxID=90262 RepID=A0A1X2HY77_9FUNG|nr:hypothetical protein BCR42DRAFT_443804 [Absidia repens]